MNIDLNNLDWSAVSAIASFAMVLVTWWTLKRSKKQNDALLKQNKEQLDELKRQWEESFRPELVFRVVRSDIAMLLEIQNIGNSKACNVCIALNGSFYDLLKQRRISSEINFDCMYMTELLEIHKGQTKYIILSLLEEGMWDRFCKKELEIAGEDNNRYKIQEKFVPRQDRK